jgi:hypothetical protein
MGGHNFFQLVEALEDVNTNASVEASWLQDPKILLIMLAPVDLVQALGGLLLRYLHFLEFAVYHLHVLLNVLLNAPVHVQPGLHLVADVVLEVVKDDRQGDHVIDVCLLTLVVGLHVQEKIILRRQLPMTLDMVDQLLQSVLGYLIEPYAPRSWLPLKVVQRIVVVVACLPSSEYGVSLCVELGLHAARLFDDSDDELAVVAWPYHEFERCCFVLLESVFADLGVLL